MYIAFPNEFNKVEAYAMDLVNNEGTEAEIIALYISRHAGSIAVATLPDSEFADCWEIVGNEVVIGSAVITRRQNEFKDLINADVAVKKYENIIVGGLEYDVGADTAFKMSITTFPNPWILADNTYPILNDPTPVIDAIAERESTLAIDGRRKKDLVLAMTTMEQLNAVDIEAL